MARLELRTWVDVIVNTDTQRYRGDVVVTSLEHPGCEFPMRCDECRSGRRTRIRAVP